MGTFRYKVRTSENIPLFPIAVILSLTLCVSSARFTVSLTDTEKRRKGKESECSLIFVPIGPCSNRSEAGGAQARARRLQI